MNYIYFIRNLEFSMDVKKFYNTNSNDFSNTRYSIWNVIKKFNNSINPNSNILDAGCGNGKNMVYLQNEGHNLIGIDFSDGLLNICKKKNLNVQNSDLRDLPFNNNTFDYVISIAVIHHLKTETDRIKALNELLRVTKKGGKVLFTMWALEQDYSSKRKMILGDNYIPFKGIIRYYHIYDKDGIINLTNKFKVENIFYDKSNWNIILQK